MDKDDGTCDSDRVRIKIDKLSFDVLVDECAMNIDDDIDIGERDVDVDVDVDKVLEEEDSDEEEDEVEGEIDAVDSYLEDDVEQGDVGDANLEAGAEDDVDEEEEEEEEAEAEGGEVEAAAAAEAEDEVEAEVAEDTIEPSCPPEGGDDDKAIKDDGCDADFEYRKKVEGHMRDFAETDNCRRDITDAYYGNPPGDRSMYTSPILSS